MEPAEFKTQLEETRIVEAIRQAEQASSAELRVYLADMAVADVLREAGRQFRRLQMHRTRLRNGVLLYIAPASRQFAILGDLGIHQHCGQAFWDELAQKMSAAFQQGRFTDALIETIERIGQRLAQHFPRGKNDRNELPDDIARG